MPEKPKPVRAKPVGQTGPISLTADGPRRHLVAFPDEKAERELMIARLFVGNITRFDDGLGPFSGLVQNDENDLDFTVQTAAGPRLLELAEFAPLAALRTRYDNAPRQFSMSELAGLYYRLIMDKSVHQGGPGRLLLTYKTHDSFFVPPPVQEMVRRQLNEDPPGFDRIYFLTPYSATDAIIFNVYPGRPHSFFTEMSTEQMAASRLHRADFSGIEVTEDGPKTRSE